jgi:hypothetical protein
MPAIACAIWLFGKTCAFASSSHAAISSSFGCDFVGRRFDLDEFASCVRPARDLYGVAWQEDLVVAGIRIGMDESLVVTKQSMGSLAHATFREVVEVTAGTIEVDPNAALATIAIAVLCDRDRRVVSEDHLRCDHFLLELHRNRLEQLVDDAIRTRRGSHAFFAGSASVLLACNLVHDGDFNTLEFASDIDANSRTESSTFRCEHTNDHLE